MITFASLKRSLEENPDSQLSLVLSDGSAIPAHFHITEVGHVTKDFIDCGGTRRTTSSCVLQTLVAHDTDHRLGSSRLASILTLAQSVLPDDDLAVEVEIDLGTSALYSLASIDREETTLRLSLAAKHTACLAPDKCGLDAPTVAKPDASPSSAQCDPAANC